MSSVAAAAATGIPPLPLQPRPRRGGCRSFLDTAVLIAWVVHVLILYPPLLTEPNRATVLFTDRDQQFNRFASASFLAVLFGLGWAAFIWRLVADTTTTSRVLLMSQIAAGFLFVLHGLLLVANGIWIIGLLLLVLALGDALWMRRARDRITFFVEVLRLVEALVASRLRQIATIAFGLSIAQFLFTLMWLAAAITALSLSNDGAISTTMLILLFSFRWTVGMFKHALTHVVSVQVTHALKKTAEATSLGSSSRPRLQSLTQRAEDAALESSLDQLERQTGGAGGDAPTAPPPRDPLLVAAEAETPNPNRTLVHTLTSGNLAALASGALLGFASPLAWGFRRAARAAAKKVAGRQALARAMALGALFSRGGSRSNNISRGGSVPDRSPTNSALGASSGAGAGIGAAFPSSPTAPPKTRQTVSSAFDEDEDEDEGEEAALDYRAPRVGAELVSAGTPSTSAVTAAAAPNFAAPPVFVTRSTAGGNNRGRSNWRATFSRLCSWCCGRTALRAYSFSDFYLKRTHKYSHVLVATQDRAWCDAATATWQAFEASAVDGLIDDDVTDRALLFGGYVGGLFLSLALGTTIHTQDLSVWLWNALIVFLLGFVGVTLPLTVLEASVSTLFVCFSQVPTVLAAVHPVLYHRFERLSEVYAFSRGKMASAAIGQGRGRELEGVFGED